MNLNLPDSVKELGVMGQKETPSLVIDPTLKKNLH
jgi:hypothetical protein